MRLVSWRERQRRMRDALGDAWTQAGNVPEDPGLREAYASLPRAPIRLISCPLVKDVNHGGLLRLADAFRLERVDLSPEADGSVDFSANRGTTEYQPYRWVPVERAVEEARKDGYKSAALTMSPRAVTVGRIEWSFPLALVLGSENEGVPPEIEERCDFSIAIPLYGMVSSLNVVAAAAIVVHEAIQVYGTQNPDFRPARQRSRRLIDG